MEHGGGGGGVGGGGGGGVSQWSRISNMWKLWINRLEMSNSPATLTYALFI